LHRPFLFRIADVKKYYLRLRVFKRMGEARINSMIVAGSGTGVGSSTVTIPAFKPMIRPVPIAGARSLEKYRTEEC